MRSLTVEEILGYEMPHNMEAEQAVIGSMFLDPETINTAIELIQPGCFYSKPHQHIFDAFVSLNTENQPADLITLTAHLQQSGQLEDIGGIGYLTKLANAVPTVGNLKHYIDIVNEKHVLRQVIAVSIAQLREVAVSGDPQKIIATMYDAATKLSDQAAPAKDFSSIIEVMKKLYDQFEKRYENRANGGVTGISSGFDDLDKMTAGFQKSDLIIVAARPSVGKTAFALNIAQNASKKTAETIAVFSLEMSEAQLVQRMISAEGNVDAGRLRTGFFESEDWERISGAIGILAQKNIYIDDTPGITVSEIRSKCMRLKREKGLGLIIIDYLQLMQIRGKKENRQAEVSEISRMLKQVARELDVPIIALSQLSRSVEQRQDKRPMLSDLRESGAIEQDADIVAFLYRDDYYDKESEKKNIIEIIIAKQRNGPVGTVELAFLKNYNKFVSLDRSHHDRGATA